MTTAELPLSGEYLSLQQLLLSTTSHRAQTGIISNSSFTEILRYCNFSDVGPFVMSELLILN